MLEQSHYLRHPFNDEFSSKMLDRYLNLLDPQHIHFLQTDLDKFEPYRAKTARPQKELSREVALAHPDHYSSPTPSQEPVHDLVKETPTYS